MARSCTSGVTVRAWCVFRGVSKHLYVSGQRLQQERMQKGLPLLDDASIAERLKVTLQRWLDATAAEVSKKIMPIGNLDLEQLLAVQSSMHKRSGFKAFCTC